MHFGQIAHCIGKQTKKLKLSDKMQKKLLTRYRVNRIICAAVEGKVLD
ncbi:hypothetical protein GCHA_2281 [Paraglaciecola chathamensis S18K6]|uniref:HTH luxR-type domain-containing protein n=2 Tax=Paraglaciecola chathamensis TaxID=368405 RepID=A0ABQ0I444_9ALTE|nr:hypothetical protein GAGA_1272 [Paraglaciecola agarilytica NO2]GAC10231.1 hypothetical protein GCHA_2281 [Paraglaciecola chathamensis S18K6]